MNCQLSKPGVYLAGIEKPTKFLSFDIHITMISSRALCYYFMYSILSVSLQTVCVQALSNVTPTPLVIIPWPNASDFAHSLNVSMGYGTVSSTGTRFSWYAAILDDLSRFSVQLPAAGCLERRGTQETATAFNCTVALNAGIFQYLPKPTFCLGELVVNSRIRQWASDNAPVFGVTADKKSFMGSLVKEQVISMNVTFGVSGFGLLVSNGTVHETGIKATGTAIHALHPNSSEIAPRTVIALDKIGRLVLVAIDGVEKKLLGLSLNETAEIFASATPGFALGGNIAYALNMDGGGSTTFVKRSIGILGAPPRIYNRPTSTDIGDIVERPVTSITCIQ